MMRLAIIVNFLCEKREASMGEVELATGIPVSSQYELFRAFGEFFPMVNLSHSRWRYSVEVSD